MKKFLALILFIGGFITSSASAQTTSVTATITDSDSQTWNNGTWTATLYNPQYPNGPFYVDGVKLTPSQIQIHGTMSSSGVLTGTFYDVVNHIGPGGSYYQVQLCPQASAPCAPVIGASPTGSSIDLSTTLSANLAGPRFPATGANAYGYGTFEINPIPVPGGSFFNVASSTTKTWSGTAWVSGGGGNFASANYVTASAGFSQIQTNGYTANNIFGDSVSAGVGATSCTQGGNCYAALLNTYAGSPTYNNFALGGDQMCDTAIKMFINLNPGASTTQLNTFWDGINDAAFGGLTGYANGPMTQCQNSMITWGTIPSTYKTLPAAMTPGTNFSATTLDGVNVIESTTNGATQVIPYTISYTGQPLVIWYLMKDGNGGCFSVTDSYDTANPLHSCNNAGMPISTHNGGIYGVGTLYFLDNITGRVPGNYSLTITVTSTTSATNIVAIAGIGVVPPAGSGNNLWEPGVPRQWLNGPNGDSSQITQYYNQTVTNNVAFNQGLGLPINFVNVRNFWFGTSPEMATNLGTGGAQFHPSVFGHSEIATGFESSTVSQTYIPNSSVLPCQGAYRVASGTDILSLSDNFVLYTGSGTVISLPPNPGPPYVEPGTRLAQGPPLPNLICLWNSPSATGNLTFAGEDTDVLLKGQLNGLSVPPGGIVILEANFVAGVTTYWNAVIVPLSGLFNLNQNTLQVIQNLNATTTSGYESIGVGALGGIYLYSNTGVAGTFNTSALYMDTSSPSNLIFKTCAQQTGLSGAPTAPPTGCGTAYQAAFLNEGQVFTAGMGFNAGINLVGTTSPLKFNASAGTTGSIAVSNGTGNTPTWSGNGFSTLVSGTVTVSSALACTPSSTCGYIVQNCGTNSSVAIGTLTIGTVVAGTSFVINSESATNTVVTSDVSKVCWQVIP